MSAVLAGSDGGAKRWPVLVGPGGFDQLCSDVTVAGPGDRSSPSESPVEFSLQVSPVKPMKPRAASFIG